MEINRAKRKSKISNTDLDEIKIKRESDQSRLNDLWSNDSTIDPTQMDMSPGSVNSECASGYQSVASTSTLSNCSMSPTSSSIGQYPTQIMQQKTQLSFAPMDPSTGSVNATINSTSGVAASILNSISSSITTTTSVTAVTPTTAASPTVQYQMHENQQSPRLEYPTKDSNTTEIVNFFLDHPSESSNYINHLMPNQKSAMEIMTKIIHSQKDAMKMIGNFCFLEFWLRK